MPDRRVALVTGGSRGIGRAISLEVASSGYVVLINFRENREAAQEVRDEIASRGGISEICQADISAAKDRKALIGFISKKFGRIDLLVNNAGIAPPVRRDLLEIEEVSYDLVLNVNLKGPFFLTQQIARLMIAQRQRSDDIRPSIVNIASIRSYSANLTGGEYCLSKAGMSMMTSLFAVRLAEYGIHVYEIRPGLMDTEMAIPVKGRYDPLIRSGVTPIRRWGRPEEVARAVASIACGDWLFSTGAVMNVDGGYHLRICE
jgi:3-oxoacyl-[acyl-carrier protein] reductase